MIYIDEVFYWPGAVAPKAFEYGRDWCHLWCDEGEEEQLHEFAKKIGLKREYFQSNQFLNHYDLVPSKRKLALLKGAVSMEVAAWYKRNKLAK